MDDADEARVSATHIFTRIALHDITVWQCMQAADPVEEAASRARMRLGAADLVTDEAGGNMLSHLILHELETFWEGVRTEVAERVRILGAEG